MKALVLKGVDQPLVLENIEKPVLESGEVLVKIKAAALNRRDYWIKKGQYAGLKFPVVLGSDGAGIVEEVYDDKYIHLLGKEVVINPALKWGEEEGYQGKEFNILGLPSNGTFAEFIKVDAANIYEKPEHLSFREAAAFPLAGLTAYRAIFQKGKLKKGENVLIVGAGGGAATFALHWAVKAGANVYVTSGSEEKIQKAKALGAIEGFNYKNENWDQELMAKVSGFDLIIDSVLGDSFAKHLNYANPGAKIVFFGATAGNLPELNGRIIFMKQIQILGTMMGSPKDFEEMLNFINHHKIHPEIDSVYTLQDAETAIHLMDSFSQFGKIVLEV